MLRFAAVGLFVDKMDVMAAFYRDVIGLDIAWDGKSGFVSCKTGSGVDFYLCERKIMESGMKVSLSYPEGTNGTMELCFDVDAFSRVDVEFKRLVEAGAKPIDEPTTAPWGLRSCFVSDPEGNLIEICSGNDDGNKG